MIEVQQTIFHADVRHAPSHYSISRLCHGDTVEAPSRYLAVDVPITCMNVSQGMDSDQPLFIILSLLNQRFNICI